jgi:hypothetical protein
MGQKIVSKPFSRYGLKNFDKIFKKKRSREMTDPTDREDENVDWGEFNTNICCTDDPHFGG